MVIQQQSDGLYTVIIDGYIIDYNLDISQAVDLVISIRNIRNGK